MVISSGFLNILFYRSTSNLPAYNCDRLVISSRITQTAVYVKESLTCTRTYFWLLTITLWPCKVAIMVTQNLLTLSTLLCLMLSAGDIQPNPGPSKYPCIECNKPVRNNQRGIQCDTCDRWGHINCLNISILHYNLLANSDDNWFCPQCSLPFVHVGDSSFHELLGSFEPNHSLNISAQDNSPGDPLANAADLKVNS